MSESDQVLRIVLGTAGLLTGYALGSWWGLLGLVPLFTGVAGVCPLYRLAGIRSRQS